MVVRWALSHAGEDGALWEHLCMGIFIPDLGVDTQFPGGSNNPAGPEDWVGISWTEYSS